jgi:hypothetical protein
VPPVMTMGDSGSASGLGTFRFQIEAPLWAADGQGHESASCWALVCPTVYTHFCSCANMCYACHASSQQGSGEIA